MLTEYEKALGLLRDALRLFAEERDICDYPLFDDLGEIVDNPYGWAKRAKRFLKDKPNPNEVI